MPAALVLIGLNSPAPLLSGLRSKVSLWLGPPSIHRRMHDLALPLPDFSARPSPAPAASRTATAANDAGGGQLQEVAAGLFVAGGRRTWMAPGSGVSSGQSRVGLCVAAQRTIVNSLLFSTAQRMSP